MDWINALILGILQGFTEFLPISSSGHLVLVEHHLGLNVDTLKSFDVLVHVGTLLAILVYFWRDIWGMIQAFFGVIFGKIKTSDAYAKLVFYVVISSFPAVILGLTAEDFIDGAFRNVTAVGISMFVVGIIFILGEFRYRSLHKIAPMEQKMKENFDEAAEYVNAAHVSKEVRGLNWWKALLIGVAQGFALIPGVSRSGSTIVAGLFLGIKRESAARFSFLMGSPVIFGAGLVTALKIPENGGFVIGITPMLIGFISSFVVGLFSIWFLMNFLKKHSLIVFSIYLIALGFSVWV